MEVLRLKGVGLLAEVEFWGQRYHETIDRACAWDSPERVCSLQEIEDTPLLDQAAPHRHRTNSIAARIRLQNPSIMTIGSS